MNKTIANHAPAVFDVLLEQIQQAHTSTFRQANTLLTNLYRSVGRTANKMVESKAWVKGIVNDLARYITQYVPDAKGPRNKNLSRINPFYRMHRDEAEECSKLWRELPRSQSMAIFSRNKSTDEREFHLNLFYIYAQYCLRTLDRQISTSFFEHTMMAARYNPFESSLHFETAKKFNDRYVLEFLGLRELHSEQDLQKYPLYYIKQFVLEQGSYFICIGESFHETFRMHSSPNTPFNCPTRNSYKPNDMSSSNNYLK